MIEDLDYREVLLNFPKVWKKTDFSLDLTKKKLTLWVVSRMYKIFCRFCKLNVSNKCNWMNTFSNTMLY
jgi:hypothetical protein